MFCICLSLGIVYLLLFYILMYIVGLRILFCDCVYCKLMLVIICV